MAKRKSDTVEEFLSVKDIRYGITISRKVLRFLFPMIWIALQCS